MPSSLVRLNDCSSRIASINAMFGTIFFRDYRGDYRSGPDGLYAIATARHGNNCENSKYALNAAAGITLACNGRWHLLTGCNADNVLILNLHLSPHAPTPHRCPAPRPSPPRQVYGNDNLASLAMPNLEDVPNLEDGSIYVRASPPLLAPPHTALHCSAVKRACRTSPLPQVDNLPEGASCDLGPVYAGQDYYGYC